MTPETLRRRINNRLLSAEQHREITQRLVAAQKTKVVQVALPPPTQECVVAYGSRLTPLLTPLLGDCTWTDAQMAAVIESKLYEVRKQFHGPNKSYADPVPSVEICDAGRSRYFRLLLNGYEIGTIG